MKKATEQAEQPTKAKTLKIRRGWDARIYAKDGDGDFPIHGAYNQPGMGWVIMAWTKDGKCTLGAGADDCDLMMQ